MSKKQYEIDHKADVSTDESQIDLSAEKMAEKTYAKSINALKPSQPTTEQQSEGNNGEQASNQFSSEKAAASYNEVESTQSSQDYFNQIREMV